MAFDPYHKWLGISKERRPITYYDLLGVERGENDTDVLRSALNQRRAFVRGKLGQGHDEYADKILRQLDAAASTLLVPETKHAYDRKLASQPKKFGKLPGKGRRRSVVLPSLVERQVVRVYGKGSGLFGDFFGITATIVAAIVIVALVAAQIPSAKIASNAGHAAASVDAKEFDARTAKLEDRRRQLIPLLEKARADKEEVLSKLRQAGVTGGDGLKGNPAAQRHAATLQQLVQDIESIQSEIEKLDEAIIHANTLKRRADQGELAISDEELSRLSVDAKQDVSVAAADPVDLEALLSEELGGGQGSEQKELRSTDEETAEVSADGTRSMAQNAADAGSQEELPSQRIGNGSSSPAASPEPDSSSLDEEIAVSLFNGVNLQGWQLVFPPGMKKQSKDNTWVADPERNVLTCRGGNHNWLESTETFQDFSLTLEWRVPPGARVAPNGSGVVVRANGLNASQHDPRGIEVDIAKEERTAWMIVYGTPLKRGSIEAVGEKNGHFAPTNPPSLNPTGRWNSCKIICEQDRISVAVNGKLVNEASGALVQAGNICLRSQNQAIEFRNIRLTEVK